MFCKFCGKEIPDGSVCDCQSANTQPMTDQTYESTSPMPQASNDTVAVSIDVGRIMSDAKTLFKMAFTQPVTVLYYAYNAACNEAQYALGAIYALLLFILPFIEFKVILGEYAKYAKNAPIGKLSFFIVLTVVLSKLVIALIPFISEKMPLKKMLALVCTATVLPLVARIILSITLMLNLYSAAIAIALFGIVMGIALDYEIFDIGFGNKKNKAFWFFMLAQIIILVIVYVFGYNMILSTLKSSGASALGNLF